MSNIRRDKRGRLEFPNGKVCSPEELDKKFTGVSNNERARLSHRVLEALPVRERSRLVTWAGSTTGARPVPMPNVELMTFLALCDYAESEGAEILDAVNQIVAQKSAAGIILPAHA